MSRVGTVTIGIDTSNYTTSLCAIDDEGIIVWEDRRVLEVKPGERGLMQSAALFQHVTILPSLLERLRDSIPTQSIDCVGVSTRPRASAGSYMPVFLAGALCARAMAAGGGSSVPVIETSHQSGHIAAGLATAPMSVETGESFVVLHLSGGTTDVLHAKRAGHDYALEVLAQSLDLHVGQFVDRVGVMLGLPFPCGPHLETMAKQYTGELSSLPSSLRAGSPSFAGPLSAAQRLYASGVSREAVAMATLRVVANSVEKMIRVAWERVGFCRVLLVGGVASNQLLRTRLQERLGPRAGQLFVCEPKYSSDNAFGVALIARDWKRHDVRKVT